MGLGETSLLRLNADRLVVKNPGGLYGLNVSRLGQTGVTSARNANLAGANIRKQLRQLRTEGLVTQEGGQGQRTTYRRIN